MQSFLLQYFEPQIFACVVLPPSGVGMDDGAGLPAELPKSDYNFYFILFLLSFFPLLLCLLLNVVNCNTYVHAHSLPTHISPLPHHLTSPLPGAMEFCDHVIFHIFLIPMASSCRSSRQWKRWRCGHTRMCTHHTPGCISERSVHEVRGVLKVRGILKYVVCCLKSCL